MRINARFDPSYAKRLEYLTRATNSSVSDVMKASVMFYYESVRGQQAPQLRHLAPWIGKAGSGRTDVASNYKDLLSDTFGGKHGKTRPSAA